MFEYAEDYSIKKEFTQCVLGETPSEELKRNITICSHCHHALYQLASVRNSGDEDECGEHAKVGGVNLNDCCVRIHIEDRDMEFEAIFGCFIVIFLFVFAVLYVLTMPGEIYMDEQTGLEPSAPPPQPAFMMVPQPVSGYPAVSSTVPSSYTYK